MLTQTATSTPSQPTVGPPPLRMFEIEILPAAGAAAFAEAWTDLAGRCLEPNIFFEPEFALPALAHLGARKRLRVIFVWDCTTKPRRLIAVLPFTLPIAWLIGRCRAWVHEQAALGTPLLDRTCPAEALDALLEAIGRRFPRLAILLLPLIPKDGPTFALLQSFAARRKARLTLFGEHARAVLQRPFVDPLSSGAAAELRRQRRRLAESGRFAYRSRHDLPGVTDGMEQFLMLEASGWKGRRRTALSRSPATAAFTRSMAWQMGHAGKIRFDSLELAGQPVAMGIILQSGARAFFWKIAYDEVHAARSPGVLFAQDLTRRQIAESNIAATNSCAIPDHRMINRLWPGRMALADVAVPLYASRASVGAAILGEKFRRALRKTGKFLRGLARQKLRK